MFENLKTGWAMGKATRKLVFEDKSLFVYPAISTILIIVEMLAIFLPAVLFVNFFNSQYYYLILLFILYVLVTFTSTYIIMAMFIAFRSFVSGKKITLTTALSEVRPYSKLILEWSIFYAIIIMVIRALESRFRGVAGLILGAAISIAISFSILFVVPVILDDKLGPINAMKKSASFIITNFGKSFGGLFYADLYSLAISLAGIGILILGILVAFAANILLLGAAVAFVGFAVLIIGIMVGYILSNVFKLILYDFITYKRIPKGFTAGMLKNSTKTRKSGVTGFAPGNI